MYLYVYVAHFNINDFKNIIVTKDDVRCLPNFEISFPLQQSKSQTLLANFLKSRMAKICLYTKLPSMISLYIPVNEIMKESEHADQ